MRGPWRLTLQIAANTPKSGSNGIDTGSDNHVGNFVRYVIETIAEIELASHVTVEIDNARSITTGLLAAGRI